MGGFGDAFIAQNNDQAGINEVQEPAPAPDLTSVYGANPNGGVQTASDVPNKDQADALLAGGHISPELHASIVNYHGLGKLGAEIGQNAKDEQTAAETYAGSLARNATEQAKNVEDKAATEHAKAEEVSRDMLARQLAMEKHEKLQAEEAAKLQQDYQDRRGHVDKMVSEASAMHADPDAARGSIGARAVAGLAVALGAMGSAYTGGPNVAAQIVQKTIEDNLQAQKDEIANKWHGAAEARSDLSDVRDQIKDHNAADAIFRAREAQKQLDYIKSLDLKYAPIQVQQNAAQVIAQLTQTRDEGIHNATLHSLQYEREAKNQQASIAGKQAELDLEGQKVALEKERAAGKEVPAEARSTMDLISQLDKLKDLKGYALPGTEKSHEAEAKLATIQAGLREHFKISERHPEIVKDILGSDITGIRSGKAATQIDALRSRLVDELRTKHGIDLGAEPGTEKPASAGAPI